MPLEAADVTPSRSIRLLVPELWMSRTPSVPARDRPSVCRADTLLVGRDGTVGTLLTSRDVIVGGSLRDRDGRTEMVLRGNDGESRTETPRGRKGTADQSAPGERDGNGGVPLNGRHGKARLGSKAKEVAR